MNRVGVVLLCLLLAQLALLGWLGSDHMRDQAQAIPLLVDSHGYIIDKLQIEDAEGNSVTLEKGDNGWRLPELDGLPADGERIGKLLETLTASDPGWAVAHSGAARQRFQVASYRFRRKLTLSAHGDELGSVYLGTSPGYRKLYARRGGEDEIYSIFLSRHQLPAQAQGWVAPGLLQVKAPLRISSDGYSLQRDSGDWLLGNGRPPPAEALRAMLKALRDMEVSGVAPAEVDASLRPAKAELIFHVESLRGEFTLEFYRLDESHYLRSSQYPFLFTIPGYDYERITGLDSMLLGGAE